MGKAKIPWICYSIGSVALFCAWCFDLYEFQINTEKAHVHMKCNNRGPIIYLVTMPLVPLLGGLKGGGLRIIMLVGRLQPLSNIRLF